MTLNTKSSMIRFAKQGRSSRCGFSRTGVCAAPPTARAGFTLMELILVLVIVVFVSSLAVPSMLRTFSGHSLQKAAGLVRTSMGQARVKAIKSGEIYAVYFVPGYSWHGVAPFKNAQEEIKIALRRARESAERIGVENFSDDLLPRGVVFGQSEANEDARAAQAVADNQGASSSDVKLVLFYPDGSSQDAVVYVENQQGAIRAIELRGMTGTSTSSRVLSK